MYQNELGRRAFIGGLSGLSSIPLLSIRSAAFEGYHEETVAFERVFEAGDALSAYDAGMVELAKRISPAYEEAKEYSSELGLSEVHAFELERLTPESPVRYNHIGPVLKIIEVLDDNLGINLPNYSLVRAYNAGAKLTSIGGILHACKSLGENSKRIVRIEKSNEDEIEDDHRVSFGISVLTLATELAFFYFPINFKFAWRTTRYATNRGLYLLRRLRAGNQIQAVVMSVIHWVVRDTPKQLTEYLLNAENLRIIYDALVSRLNIEQELKGIGSDYQFGSFNNEIEFVRALSKPAGEFLNGISQEDILREAGIETGQ